MKSPKAIFISERRVPSPSRSCPGVLTYFQNQYPLIKITIHSMPSSLIMESVENGLIDIGIAYLFESNPNLESAVLYYDSFELVVSP